MKTLFKILSVLALLSVPFPAFADGPLKIVTTLSSYADIAKTIGGDFVETKFVAPPKFNPHFIEPKPSDVLKVKKSDLFIHSGLDLEAWRGPLIDAAARSDIRPGGERQLDLSAGIRVLEVPDHPVSRSEGDIHLYGNPHYWVDPRNGRIIASEIAAKLAEIDPSHRTDYEQNLKSFTAKLDAKIEELQAKLAPYRGKELVGYHNEWVYLMDFAGLRMTQFLEPKPGIPPTPKQIEFISDYLKKNNIRGIVQASYFPTEAAEKISRGTGAKVLLVCQNVGELPEASDYLSLVDYDVQQLIRGLSNE